MRSTATTRNKNTATVNQINPPKKHMQSFWNLLESPHIGERSDFSSTSTLILREETSALHTICTDEHDCDDDAPLGLTIAEFPPICIIKDKQSICSSAIRSKTFDDSGFVIGEYVEDACVVKHVEVGSIAYRAGFRKGDVVCIAPRFNDVGNSNLELRFATYEEIRAYLKSRTRPLTLVVRRFQRSNTNVSNGFRKTTTGASSSTCRDDADDPISVEKSMDTLYVRCKRVYGWDDALTKRVQQSYLQFMKLVVSLEDFSCQTLSPSKLVHEMWQQHVLDVKAYKLFCEKLCDESDHLILFDPDKKCTNLEQTRLFLKAKYEREVDNEIWRDEYHLPKVVHAAAASDDSHLSNASTIKELSSPSLPNSLVARDAEASEPLPTCTNNTKSRTSNEIACVKNISGDGSGGVDVRNKKRLRNEAVESKPSSDADRPFAVTSNVNITKPSTDQLQSTDYPISARTHDDEEDKGSEFIITLNMEQCKSGTIVKCKLDPTVVTIRKIIKKAAEELGVERASIEIIHVGHGVISKGTLASNNVQSGDELDVLPLQFF
uniref:Ubiquitin-like domain-containing protein n=1 Tax=Leptocylindrus danicus TaxID=163516 RepID=A0A7S2LRH9_9STRA